MCKVITAFGAFLLLISIEMAAAENSPLSNPSCPRGLPPSGTLPMITYQMQFCPMRDLPMECRREFFVNDSSSGEFRQGVETCYNEERACVVFVDLNNDGRRDMIMEHGAGYQGTAGSDWVIFLCGEDGKYQTAGTFLAHDWALLPDTTGTPLIVFTARFGWDVLMVNVSKIVNREKKDELSARLTFTDPDDSSILMKYLTRYVTVLPWNFPTPRLMYSVKSEKDSSSAISVVAVDGRDYFVKFTITGKTSGKFCIFLRDEKDKYAEDEEHMEITVKFSSPADEKLIQYLLNTKFTAQQVNQ